MNQPHHAIVGITCLLVITLLTPSLSATASEPHPLVFGSFESPDDLKVITAIRTSFCTISEHATEGQNALRIDFEPVEWPNVYFQAPATGWNWTE